MDSIVRYKFAGENDSLPEYKWEYYHNSNEVQTFYGLYFLNYNRWNLIEYQQKTFDQLGKQIEQIEHATQERGLGYPWVKHEWEYDSDDNLRYLYKYHKYEEQQGWIPNTKQEFKNSQTGRLIQKLYFTWSGDLGDWNPNLLYTYDYNSLGLEIEQLIDIWNSNTHRWETYRKFLTTYTPDGIKLSEYTYSWIPNLSTWERRTDFWTEYDSLGRISKQMTSNIGASQLVEYVYDSMGNFTAFISNSPPWIGNYDPHIKYEITINSNNQRVKEVMYWLINSEWTLYNKKENLFNTFGNISLSTFHNWDQKGNNWILTRRSYYYYNNQSTAVSDFVIGQIRVFPNPTSGIINLSGLSQLAEVKIYSIQGKLLKSEHQVENTFDISDLPAGVYFLNLTSGDTILKKRIVKR